MTDTTSTGEPAATNEDASAADAPGTDVAAIVLALLHGEVMPTEEVEPVSVPTELILPAVLEATSGLVAHGKRCHAASRCSFTPPPLRMFLKMSAESILRFGHRQITNVLFDYPDWEFTSTVRKHVLEDEQELADEVRDGPLTNARLREFLAADPTPNAQRLGSVLWALGLRETAERELFRALAPLACQSEPAPDEAPNESPREPAKSSRRRKKKEERAAADELKQARRDLRVTSRKLAEANGDKERLEEALLAAEGATQEREQRITELDRELRLARGSAQAVQRQRDRADSLARDLHGDIEKLRAEASESSTDRSRLSGQLAMKNREIELLRARLRAIPTGADAVHEFLVAEEERIDQALVIEQGADRQRAQEAHATHRRLEAAFLDAYPEYRQPRPPVLATRSELRLTTLGGSDEIGRSCYLLELGGHSIVVDCGIRIGQGALDGLVPAIERIDKVDAVLLTHAHTDHLGWLPALVNRFTKDPFPIYCTEATAELAPIMLDDCRKHYLVTTQRLRRQRAFSSLGEEVRDAYEREDLFETETRFYACSWGEPEVLPMSEVSLRFVPAGHILGAASVLIEGEGRRIFISGDMSSEAQLTVGPAEWSTFAELDLDLMLLESTYGDCLRPPATDARAQLVEFASRTIDGPGSLILPCFALGRAQEVLRILRDAMEDGTLPPVTVWIDGMIRRINPIYADRTDLLLPSNFMQVDAPGERLDVIEQARRDPVIIVTTSGMVTGGPAVEYAAALLAEPKNRMALTGYQDEGSPGRALLALAAGGTGSRTVEVANEEGESVQITAAAPAKTFGLSAHADQAGLVSYASTLRPRCIALVHGETTKQALLRAKLADTLPNSTIRCGPEELRID